VLRRYDAVVFLSTTGDVLNATQQRAFERYIQAGGGFTGIHAAADTEYDWNWYGHLVGGYFLSHPPGTPDATVHVEDGEHHSTEGLPTPWPRTDEWYNYRSPDYQDPDVPDGDYSPREGGVHVLLTVDEATYAEGDGSDGVNDDHPISWCQAYDGGRSWYTGMGHTAGTFSEPEFLLHLLGGIETAAGMPGTEGCDPPNKAPSVQAAADPDTGQAPLKVRFSAAGSDADGDQLTYLWEFGDGQRSFRQNPTHVYQQPGQYSAKVTVTDGNGGSASATVAVTVTNPPGNAAPTVRAAAEPGSERLTVRFSAAGIDPDGDPLAYAWDFGDGDVAYGERAVHTYDERGTYTARVTVTDPRGATGTATLTIRLSRSGFFAVAGESASQPGVRVASTFDAARVVKRGLRYRVSCEERCRVTSTLRMRGGDEQRLGASSARRIGAGKSRTVVVRLDRRVRRKLVAGMRAAALSRLRATLTVRVITANATTVLWRGVTLRR
jgi:PKD repeat protein